MYLFFFSFKNVSLWIYTSKVQIFTASSFFSINSPNRINLHKCISKPHRTHHWSSFTKIKWGGIFHTPDQPCENSARCIIHQRSFLAVQMPRAFFHWPLYQAPFQQVLPFSLYTGNIKFLLLSSLKIDWEGIWAQLLSWSELIKVISQQNIEVIKMFPVSFNPCVTNRARNSE